MRVWIDMANSPHPLFFAPIAKRLEALGHDVLVTARDNAQTVELTREHWPDAAVIGGESPPGRAAKARAIARRVRDLGRWAREHRVDVALSHNSYAQVVAARVRRIPAVTAMDYEGQPANHLAFRLARRVILPEPLRGAGLERQGARPGKTVFYPGLKEELYLGDFQPDRSVLERLGIERDGRRVVVLRSPPSRAAYHRFGNPIFEAILERLGAEPDVVAVALVRHAEQRDAVAAMALDNVVVPTSAVDSRSLMYHADLVIGAGGTMTREAALLGVPTISIFAGSPPAVDRWLEQRGALRRIERAEEILPVQQRAQEPRTPEALRSRSDELVDVFVKFALGT